MVTKPPLWAVKHTHKSCLQLDRLEQREGDMGVWNQIELGDALRQFQLETTAEDYHFARLPDDFLPAVLKLPLGGFAPDFIRLGPYDFASRRLREAMALPPETVQYMPVTLLSGTPEAYARDYRVMRVLVQQSVMDLEESEVTTSKSGWVWREIERFAVRADYTPRFDLFALEEDPAMILATDSLAEKVLKAGCTGILFIEPEGYKPGYPVKRSYDYRTAEGVAQSPPDKRI